MSQLSQPNE